MIFMYKEVKV